MKATDDTAKAQLAALDYLKKAPLSVGQVKQRLLNRGFSQSVAEQAIESLTQSGDLSDRNLALSLSEKAINNGRGPRWIEQALTRRYFVGEDIEHCLALARSKADEVAQAILRRRYGPVALTEASTRPKAARFLHGRGFEEETIEDALQAVLPPIEY
jgi:SOS response regulatory protein OraA/RecX